MSENIFFDTAGTRSASRKSELSLAGFAYRRRDLWIRHVLERPKSELSDSHKVVAIHLAMRTNPERPEAWPRQSTIARDLDMSVPTVKRAVKALVELELVAVRRVKGTRGHPVNHYSLISFWEG